MTDTHGSEFLSAFGKSANNYQQALVKVQEGFRSRLPKQKMMILDCLNIACCYKIFVGRAQLITYIVKKTMYFGAQKTSAIHTSNASRRLKCERLPENQSTRVTLAVG